MMEDKPCPVNLHVAKNYRGCVYIEWDDPDDVPRDAKYKVELQKTSEKRKKLNYWITLGEDCLPPFRLSKIFVGQKYSVQITLMDKKKAKGNRQLDVTVISETSPPLRTKEKPSFDGGYISISWAKPEFNGGSPITKYEIWMDEEGDNRYTYVAEVDYSKTKYTFTEQMSKPPYSVDVFAKNEFGCSLRPAQFNDFHPTDGSHSCGPAPLIYTRTGTKSPEEGGQEVAKGPITADERNIKIESLDKMLLEQIESIIVVNATEEHDDELLANIFGCDRNQLRNNISKQTIAAIIKRIQYYCIDVLADAFTELRIHPTLCHFIRYKRAQDTADEPMDTGEVNSAAAAGASDTAQVIDDSKEVQCGDSIDKAFISFASEASNIPNIKINEFRHSEEELMIYINTDEGVSFSDSQRKLKDIAKLFHHPNVQVTSDDPPKLNIKLCCNLVIGGEITVEAWSQTVKSGRVGGYFRYQDNSYAITVDHIFSNCKDCTLVEMRNPNSNTQHRPRKRLGMKIDGQHILPSDENLSTDICLLQLLHSDQTTISNAFAGVSADSIKFRFEPSLDNPVTWGPNVDVYICGRSRYEPCGKGRIRHIRRTGGGQVKSIEVEIYDGTKVVTAGDSGTLVTNTKPVEHLSPDDTKGPMWVGVYGMISGTTKEGLAIIFPLDSQLRRLGVSSYSRLTKEIVSEFYHEGDSK